MTDKATEPRAAEGSADGQPDNGAAGDEPMNDAQRSRLKTLCEEANAEFDDKLTKAEASKRIDELQSHAGGGKHHPNPDVAEGLVSPDPTGNPASLGDHDRPTPPEGAPSAF